jgi:polyferredoxin
VTLADGSIRNGYTARLLNKRPVERRFAVEVEGLPGARVEVVGIEAEGWHPVVGIGPDSTREVRLLVFAPPGAKPEKSTAVEFRIIDLASAEAATAQDFFKVP